MIRKTLPGPRQGIALVIVLSMIVLITVLVVGFTVSMRTERQASHSASENERTKLVAESALAHAIGILSSNIPQPVPPGATLTPVNWIVNPGQLTLVTGQSGVTQIPLYSKSNVVPATTTNLNLVQPVSNQPPVLGTTDSMYVEWINMFQNPALPYSDTNPLAARYAFWIDDESSKININTASGKPVSMDFTKVTPGVINVNGATYPLGHPSSLNLDVLGSIDVSGLATAIGTGGGFNDIEAIKPYVTSGDPNVFFNANKFNLTAWSNDSEFNVFGKPRLYMTRKMIGQLGVNMPAFQFFRDADAPVYFPTDENMNAGDVLSLYYTAAGISNILGKYYWPGMPTMTFADKWAKDNNGVAIPYAGMGKVGEREVDQFAWNLVSMGHFASNDFDANPAISPARVYSYFTNLQNKTVSGQAGWSGTANQPDASVEIGALSGKPIIPLYPVPLVDEICLVITPHALPTLGKYDLNVSLVAELWLPPGYPSCDLSYFGPPNYPAGTNFVLGLTYLSYTVTQGSITASQEDTKYRNSGAPGEMNGVKALYAYAAGAAMNPGDYIQIASNGPSFNIRNGPGFGNQTGPGFTRTGGTIHCDFKMRAYAGINVNDFATTQMMPVWDTRVPVASVVSSHAQPWDPQPPSNPPAAFAVPADDRHPSDSPHDYIELSFDLDPTLFSAGTGIKRSLEIADPRLSGLAKMWVPVPPSSLVGNSGQDANTLGSINSATTSAVEAGWDLKKFAFLDFNPPANATYSRPPSIGMISLLPTGMQRGIPGATLKFQPSQNTNNLPDWLLLDLLAPTSSAANLASMSLMNRTTGKLNVNGAISPSTSGFSIPQRWQPIQALFQNMPRGSASGGPSTVVSNILNHTLASGGQDFGAPGIYDYPGEICEVAGVADTGTTDWDKEVLIRDLASNLTTHSNVFSVWGVAQTIKKKTGNHQYNTYEPGDLITGEKRFQAIVERYIWPGNDNAAGNAHVSSTGTYDKLSSTRTQPGLPAPSYSGGAWEALDGPNAPTYPPSGSTPGPWTNNAAAAWTNSTIENANNPVGAVMKYRVVSFRYING